MAVNRILVLVLTALGLVPFTATAQRDEAYDAAYDSVGGYGAGTLDERVAKLEKRLSSGTLTEMLKRVEQLQGDLASMRGKMEELSNEVETLRSQQKEMYTDLEQRLQPAPAAGEQAPAGGTPGEGQQPGAETPGTAPPPVSAPAPAATSKPAAPAPAAISSGRQEAYDKAFNLLKEGKYPESIRAFKSFLSAYPSGEYVDNAIYWTGEAYYVLRDFPASRESFRRLIKEQPQSPKVPDALLKIGYIEYDANQWANARELLNDVIKRYPGSSAAKLAEKRLAKMKQEGH
ncbi:MAG: uncharacterized protein H6R26_1387 [Proteobacteria bacterium]|nr:uncharacterized protein [Pseudomonadota bacterium]